LLRSLRSQQKKTTSQSAHHRRPFHSQHREHVPPARRRYITRPYPSKYLLPR
jgi:hypothetical protein